MITDAILTPEEVVRLTGRQHTSAQSQFLTEKGIKHLINRENQVIVTWTWLNGPVPVQKEEEPDFESLRNAQAS